MLNLFIDTSTSISTIFLMNENNILSLKKNEIKNDHSKYINSQIEEILIENNIEINDLTSITVLNGPGSYTGLRISLATAKGICYALSIPLILINKLHIIANCVENKIKSFGVICLARENEYFFSTYNQLKENIISPTIISHVDLLQFQNDNPSFLFFTNEELIFEKNSDIICLFSNYSNQSIFEICIQKLRLQKFDNLFNSEPFYLKNVYINCKSN